MANPQVQGMGEQESAEQLLIQTRGGDDDGGDHQEQGGEPQGEGPLAVPPRGPTPPRNGPRGEPPGTAQPSAVRVPLAAVGYLPDPVTLNNIVEGGSTFALVLAYTGVDADIGRKFLQKAGLSEEDLFNTVATIRDDEIENTLDEVALEEESPIPLGVKSKIRTAFKIARSLSGIQPAAPPLPISTTTSLGSEAKDITTDPNTIALSDTVDQTSKAVVKILPNAQLKKMRARFVKHNGVKPTEDEDVTKEQLSALFVAVFTMISVYADFALWVPFWRRMLKKKRFMGVVPDEHGELHTVELLGPSCFDAWESCYNVLSPPVLCWI